MTATLTTVPPEASEEANQPRNRRMRRLVLCLVGFVLAVVAGVWIVLFSGWLDVREVRVEGESSIGQQAVLEAAAVPTDTPLALVDTGLVSERVRALLPVADAQVNRAWPHTLVVTVTPRVPVGFVMEAQSGSLVDRKGVQFETLLPAASESSQGAESQSEPTGDGSQESSTDPSPITAELPQAPTNLPQLVGGDPDGMRSALAVAEALPPELRERVSSIVVVDGHIRLTLRTPMDTAESADGGQAASSDQGSDSSKSEVDDGGGLVYWGTAEESALKAKVLLGLMSGEGYAFYDVSTPGFPTGSAGVPSTTAKLMGLQDPSGTGSDSGATATAEPSAGSAQGDAGAEPQGQSGTSQESGTGQSAGPTETPTGLQ